MARVDKWLWAVRLFPTRSRATEACSDGNVEVNGRRAKPALKVVVGDRIEVRDKRRLRVVEVVDPIERRVGAPLAVECYVDHTPVEPALPDDTPLAGLRDRGAGRPTKRDRRRLDALKHRGDEPR